MKLERLEIIHLPGLSSGFALKGLAAGVTLITGPNAAGKSSLVRALGFLLKDPQSNDAPVTLAADFQDGDQQWRVERTGQQTQWRCNGVPTARPNLPTADQLGRYCLSMEDLIAADTTDTSLAQELQRSLRGGFDLNEVRTATEIGARHGLIEERQLVQAQNALREAERAADALRVRQESIPQLDQEIAQARGAQEQLGRIKRAGELLDAVRTRQASEEKLARFPENMFKITGQELENVATLKKRLEVSEDKRREQAQSQRQARALLEEAGLNEADLDTAGRDLEALEALEKKLRRIEVLHSDRAHSVALQSKQQAALDTAARALGGGAPPNLDMESLKQAEDFAGDLLKLRAAQVQLTTRIGLLGNAPDEQEVRNHERAVDALRNWLYAQSGGQDKRKLAVPLWASVALAVASILGLVYAPLLVPIALSSLLLVALAWALWKLFRASSEATNLRQKDAVQRFEETGLATPKWSLAPVRSHLTDLEDALGGFAAQKHKAEGALEARSRLSEVETGLSELQAKQEQLAESIGFDPLMPVTALDRFIRLTKDWDGARTELEINTQAVVGLDTQIATALKEARGILSRWQEGSDTLAEADLDKLGAVCESFKSKLKTAANASDAIKLAEHMITSHEEESARHQEDLAKVYQDVGLSKDEHLLLVEHLQQRPSWLAACEELREADGREKQLRRELEGDDALLEMVDSRDESSLDERMREQEHLAERLEELRNQRAQSHADISNAESDHALENVIAKRVEAQAKLEQKRDELLVRESTSLLLNQIEADYRTTHEPEVLSQAGALFQQVTAHDFELQLSEDGGFQARDTQQNKVRKLDELSTGTRMQLLLAVRVAWVRAQDGDGKTLPLFLDEALTTSDESRFIEVAKSLDRLSSSSGIQVIYLSARRNEQDLWRAAIGRDPHLIDLAQLRGQGDADQTPEFEVTPSEPIPRPGGGALEYAKELRILGIDPALDAGEIHLFHLLRDDLDLLYQLMDSLRIRTLGQLESYIDHSARVEHHGRPEFSKLKDRCRSARAWISAWRQGRGRPVDALELEASGAFSRRYLAEATTLARTEPIDRDAHRFLAVLREGALKGFQTKKIDDFEAWLTLQDCLDDRPILSTDQRRQVVLREYDLENRAKLEDIGQCIDWLESALQQTK